MKAESCPVCGGIGRSGRCAYDSDGDVYEPDCDVCDGTGNVHVDVAARGLGYRDDAHRRREERRLVRAIA